MNHKPSLEKMLPTGSLAEVSGWRAGLACTLALQSLLTLGVSMRHN